MNRKTKATKKSAPVVKAVAPTQQEKTMNTFTKVRVNKFGMVLYRRGDSRGTLAINKTMFADAENPPETINLDAPLSAPGAARAASPEKISKLEASIKKDQERAAKKQEKLAKLQVRVQTEEAAAAV